VYKPMFCTFIFAVLLLKYCFPTGDQLQRYCASDIFYSSQIAYNCYLLPNGVTEQSKQLVRHDVTAGLPC